MSSLFAQQLQVYAEKYTFYVDYITLVIGTIGNILNILVFTKLKLFRGNRCAFYLIVESFANIVLVCHTVLPQIFQLIYGNDPSDISVIWCKIKSSSGQTCRLLIASTVCFQAIDQFLSTNHQYYLRQLTTLKLARYSVFVSTIVWFLQTIPYIIFNNIVPPSGCIITNQGLTYYYSFAYYICLTGIGPITTSSFFSLLAYRNVRHLVRRQIPIERRRLDRQMTAMIFVRVIVYVILLSPYTIYRIYILNVNIPSEDTLRNAINQLISEVVSVLFLWVYSSNFYVFLVTSSRFRRQVKAFLVKKCWQSMKQWCNSNRNEVHPINMNSVASDMELQ